MATPNPYIALYLANGTTRVTEWDCGGHDTVFIEPSGYLLIPDGSSTISSTIPFTIKCAAGFKTLGSTTLKLVNNSITKNRWRFSLTTDFSTSVWGADCVITDAITATAINVYAQARALGTVSASVTTTSDCVDDDVSIHIAIETTIIKG